MLKESFHWPDPGTLIPFDCGSVPAPNYWDFDITDSGTVIQLSEPSGQEKLYLHVYDSFDNHVGLNYDTNEIELEIPGSYYSDINNEITIIIPPSVTAFRNYVDSTYSEKELETYSLSIVSVNETALVSTLKENNVITKGENQEIAFCYLSVNSEYGTTFGEGWYKEGTEVIFSVSPSVISTEFLSSKALVGWTGDVQINDKIGKTIMNNNIQSVTAIWTEDCWSLYLVILVTIVLFVLSGSILYFKKRK